MLYKSWLEARQLNKLSSGTYSFLSHSNKVECAVKQSINFFIYMSGLNKFALDQGAR